MLYLPADTRGSSLDAEDILVQPDAWGVPVKAEDLVKGGVDLPGEKEGRLLVECGAALANSSYAWMEHCQWQWCSGPSHGETGLAMYIRGAGQRWVDPGQAPALCYRVRLQGGDYVIWIRAMMWGDDTCHFTIGLDEARALPPGDTLPDLLGSVSGDTPMSRSGSGSRSGRLHWGQESIPCGS